MSSPSRSAAAGSLLGDMIEIVPDRFYFATLTRVPRNTSDAVYFSVDGELHYESFCLDFGPYNLAMVARYYDRVVELMDSPEHAGKRIVHVTQPEAQTRANAAALAGIFAALALQQTPAQVAAALATARPPLAAFHDASHLPSTFDLTVADVVAGAHQAMLHGWLDLTTFDVEEYEFYERVENGDFNWIVPGKFVALAGPHNVRHVQNGYPHLCPEDYFAYFRATGVTDVVRLNKRLYDRNKFLRAGFEHHDLFFIDGSTPPQRVLDEFLAAAENAAGAVVVHCKAGLGRTGSLIGCYLMKHYRLTAREAIAWLRLARPGSVIGPQQHYLEHQQAAMWRQGQALGVTRRNDAQRPAWASIDLATLHAPALPATPTRTLPAANALATSTSAATAAQRTEGATAGARSRLMAAEDAAEAEAGAEAGQQRRRAGHSRAARAGEVEVVTPLPASLPSGGRRSASADTGAVDVEADETGEGGAPTQGDLLTRAKAAAQHHLQQQQQQRLVPSWQRGGGSSSSSSSKPESSVPVPVPPATAVRT